MQAKHEHREYAANLQVWVGRYKNLTNLPHWHSDHEIVYAENGGAAIHIGDRLYRIKQGQAVFIHSKSVHYIQGDEGSILLMFIFAQKPLQRITENFRLAAPMLGGEYDFRGLFRLISGDLHSPARLAPISANNRIERLVLDIFMSEQTCRTQSETGSDDAFRRLLDDIDKNYPNYTLAAAADFMAVSQSHFSKLFKHMADTTFTKYLNMVRVEKAIELMHDGGKTITEVAICCGFGSIRNFNRVFRDITGYAPRCLPEDYNPFSVHPTYTAGNTEAFDPTENTSELL